MKRNRLFILTLWAMCLIAPLTALAQTVHVVTSDNVNQIFSGDGYTLGDAVSAGDVLDFRGLIEIGDGTDNDKGHGLVINKKVNIVSSTGDAVIRLHTVAGSLLGEAQGNSFVVNAGAAGSTISGIRLENTQTWIYNTSNIQFTNVTMHVEDARVGSGVGHVAVRYSNHVIFDHCTVYTKNNGGSSSLVLTGSSNTTIKNSVIEGEGNVGYLLYLGNPWNVNDRPENFEVVSNYNTVRDCTIKYNDTGQKVGITISGKGYKIDNNKLDHCTLGGGGGTESSKNYFRNNTIKNTTSVGMSASDYSVVENNTVDGSLTVGNESTVKDNVVNGNVTITKTTTSFTGNRVNGTLTLNRGSNGNNDGNSITGNTIISEGDYVLL